MKPSSNSPTYNLFIFGVGTVGSQLVGQVLEQQESIRERRGAGLRIAALANSKGIVIDPKGIGHNWQSRLVKEQQLLSPEEIIQQAQSLGLDNLILVDATPSIAFTQSYPEFIEGGFDLVAANKIANTLDWGFYQEIRALLEQHDRRFLYETNVGAGLPLVDTVRQLHHSGDRIHRIRGVFSGCLSFIFNTYSKGERPFSKVLLEAQARGLTEPDPREDLSGNDVARKVLILARELDLEVEFADIEVENLIPEHLAGESEYEVFLERIEDLDPIFAGRKGSQSPGHVLRYTGEILVDQPKLTVRLESVPRESPLGQVTGQDAIFEVYTDSYGDNPLVIQGAGAGGVVTARGILGDVLRLAHPDRKQTLRPLLTGPGN